MFGYESKISNLKIENDRINGILKSRLGEIEDWKSRYSTLEKNFNNYSNVEKEKKVLEDRCNHQIKQNQELKYTISKLQHDITGHRKNESQLKDIERNNTNLTKEV